MKFADLAAGGRALAPLVAAALAEAQTRPRAQDEGPQCDAPGSPDPVVVLGVSPYGLPVAGEVAQLLDVAVTPLVLTRTDDVVGVDLPDGLAGRTVIVVDDGVESGAAAVAIARALRSVGAARTVLAVPVCPREAQANLAYSYDLIVAVVRPLLRRDLRWHYATLS